MLFPSLDSRKRRIFFLLVAFAIALPSRPVFSRDDHTKTLRFSQTVLDSALSPGTATHAASAEAYKVRQCRKGQCRFHLRLEGYGR